MSLSLGRIDPRDRRCARCWEHPDRHQPRCPNNHMIQIPHCSLDLGGCGRPRGEHDEHCPRYWKNASPYGRKSA